MERKPVCILFTSGIFPPAIGGPAAVLSYLVPTLVQRGYSCTVLTYGEKDKEERSYPLTRIPLARPQPWRFFSLLRKTFSLANDHDIVYALDTYSHGLAAALVCRLKKKPLILRFTGDSAWEHDFNSGRTAADIVAWQNKRHSLATCWRIWRRDFILKTAKKIITDCEFLKNLLAAIGVDKNKVTVINNAIEPLPETDQAKNFGNHVLLTQCRLVPWKGVAALIDALLIIHKRFPDTKLLIMGEGPEKEKLELKVARHSGGQASYQLQDSVIFLGKVTDKKQKKAYYQASKIFILNTFYEGMSNTLPEAMSEGLPVITTAAGGNPEFVDETCGRLVEYNNTQQIADAVLELFASPDLAKRLGENGRERTRRYTVEELAEKNIKVIKELLLNYY